MNGNYVFSITPGELLKDLYKAYLDARKGKRGKEYQLRFEYRLEENLVELRDELLSRNYRPRPSTCFVIHEPKMREVFAASFRDRVVHHLFYNYVHELFERNFIHDCYSCIKGRGTHFGIDRLRHHIRSVSRGFSQPCYVLKMDIKGYFMGIDRGRLLAICRETLNRMRDRPSGTGGKTWGEVLDYPFVDYLLESIINNDPTARCVMLGKVSEWKMLPPEKSLFTTEAGHGLPIGNLSSQLFSNIYMNVFDQFAKRELGCKHYGRYVDDAFVVSGDRKWLQTLIPLIEVFLGEHLDLRLNPDKVRIWDAYQGVEFLGAYLRPFRTYISSHALRRIKGHLLAWPSKEASQPTFGISCPVTLQEIFQGHPGCSRISISQGVSYISNFSAVSPNLFQSYSSPSPSRLRLLQSRVNSWLGVLSHYKSHCLRRVLFGHLATLPGTFSSDWLRFRPAHTLPFGK